MIKRSQYVSVSGIFGQTTIDIGLIRTNHIRCKTTHISIECDITKIGNIVIDCNRCRSHIAETRVRNIR